MSWIQIPTLYGLVRISGKPIHCEFPLIRQSVDRSQEFLKLPIPIPI